MRAAASLTSCAALRLVLAPGTAVAKGVDTLPLDGDDRAASVLIAPQLRALAARLRLLCRLKGAVQRLHVPVEATHRQHGGQVLQAQQQHDSTLRQPSSYFGAQPRPCYVQPLFKRKLRQQKGPR